MSLSISTDWSTFDLDRVIPFLQASYWGARRTPEDIKRSFAGSYVVGLFDDGSQIGMARAMSDGVFSAYIYDLFVFEEHRGKGHAHRLLEAIMSHPDLKDVTGWMLATRDAHGLYEEYGFEPVEAGRYMSLTRSGAL